MIYTSNHDKHAIIDGLRAIYERAVREKTGVSFILSEEDQSLVSELDIQNLRDDTGYNAMCSHSC